MKQDLAVQTLPVSVHEHEFSTLAICLVEADIANGGRTLLPDVIPFGLLASSQLA